ncbi:MAG: radical SAM protein [Fimbriimonadaceae bacterium]|nr:radical SAM protein [Fimbriimonadaceae bacterium]
MQLTLIEPEKPSTPLSLNHACEVKSRLSKSILARGNGYTRGYDFTLNPYVGCQFGCAYCYAVFFVPDVEKAQNWGKWVEVKENALALLRTHTGLAGSSIFIGSVTDPYQPIERQTRLTRSLLEFMATVHPQPRIVIQTRSPFVVDDVAILRRFAHLRVNMSVTTDSEVIRKRFEPNCASIDRRLQALTHLKAQGIRTCACISPMLPINDPKDFARRLIETGTDRVGASYFHRGDGRPFATSTRKIGLELAEEYGWTAEKFVETVQQLRRYLPQYEGSGMAFRPE